MAFLFVSDAVATDIAKILPDPVVVHIRRGDGEQRVVFLKDVGAPVPEVAVSDASGAYSVLSKTDIHATVDGSPPDRLFSVLIRVSTKQLVTAGATHYAVLLLSTNVTKEGASLLQVPFTIQNDATVNAEALATSLDIVSGWEQPESITFLLRNTGNIPISKISFASSSLTDATEHSVYTATSSEADLGKGPIEPSHERAVSLAVGYPRIAGIFVGDLYITLNGEKTIKLPITIRSRGPFGEYGAPLLLFAVVVGLGFWLSSALNDWYSGGGLQRAQSELSLHKAQAELAGQRRLIEGWLSSVSTKNPIPKTPRAQLRIQGYVLELDNELPKLADLSLSELTSKVDYFAYAVSISETFMSALTAATAQWATNDTELTNVVQALDSVAVPAPSATGVAAYHSALAGEMSKVVSLGGAKTELRRARARWTPAFVQRKIKLMARLYGWTVGIVVFGTAYQSFYAHNLGFGTVTDYIVVGLWALGLTATGTQIVTRIHK